MAPEQPKRRPRWFYGWTIVGVISLISFAGGVETNPVLGLFQGPITGEFGWSRSVFALPMSIGSFIGGLAALAAGPVMDRYGARWVMTVAVVLMGLVFVLMGAMQELWQHFALHVAGRAIIASTFFMVVGVVIPKWFVVMRGRAVGMAGLGQRLGQIAFPVMIERIIAFGTWRNAGVAMGVTVWVSALLPTLLLLRRQPEDHGLRPDGALPDLRRGTSTAGRTRPPMEVSFGWSEVVRTPAFYILAVSLSIQSFAATSTNFHWFSYLTDNELSTSVAVVSLSLTPLAGMPASVAAGFLAEKMPVQYLMAFSYLLMAVSIGGLLLADNAGMAYAVGVVYGVSTGVMITITQVIWADYFGRASIGAIRGIVSPIHMLSNAAGPLVAAVSFDATGSYQLIFTITALMSLAAAGLIVLARRPIRSGPGLNS